MSAHQLYTISSKLRATPLPFTTHPKNAKISTMSIKSVLAAVIGFTIVACGNGGNPMSLGEPSGGDGDDSGVLGATLNLSG